MLACEMDVLIGIDTTLTIVSALLATVFTFAALGSGPFQERYKEKRRRDMRSWRRKSRGLQPRQEEEEPSGESRLLATTDARDGYYDQSDDNRRSEEHDLEENEWEADSRHDSGYVSKQTSYKDTQPFGDNHGQQINGDGNMKNMIHLSMSQTDTLVDRNDMQHTSVSSASLPPLSRTSTSSDISSSAPSLGLGQFLAPRYSDRNGQATNVFTATIVPLWAGCTLVNAFKGFWWSLAITSMHYVGMLGLQVPDGHVTFNPAIVALSALISWVVCTIGCILMAHMETHLSQQLLFSLVATSGVAAMHFTGMRAATFVTTRPPSDKRGYPPELAVAVATVAIVTCLAANFLLAHSATVSRDKLAEVVMTRRKLWRTIAQKESAEAAAAARSDFIASASHEIRTPLHHLQGYSDLLSRTELSDESRLLLHAIQGATKTLSSITNNVLDWSRIENDSEAAYRPVDLDIRAVCDSVMNLLPASDDDADVDLFVVVAPDVPKTLLMDEAYINRVLMNLLSNAMKFTKSGYILLVLEMTTGDLIITVKDSGCGIPPNFLPHMFEPFKQAQTRSMSRGTGLGLSIIRQLLTKMNGTIDVVSNYEKDVPEGQNGSTFTITIPLPPRTTMSGPSSPTSATPPRVAVLDNQRHPQAKEGLHMAWSKAGFEPTIVETCADFVGVEWKYVHADVERLLNDTTLRAKLFETQFTILVPFDTQNELKQLPNLPSHTNVVPLQKPLRWHTFDARVASARARPLNKTAPMKVRFASDEAIINEQSRRNSSPTKAPTKRFTILLAEDNPINQRLGRKMISSLGHDVIVAEDGQDAIDQVKRHDAVIDIILMDQSMPRKDGVTACLEIRALEKAGVLTKRHRPIIAVTAVVGVNAQAMCREAGMDDFLAKPMSLARLESTLSAYLPVNG